jgi:glycosyltransferase involved in cell wall biosynthesis/ubiquinone/menaquinone biosynthesis C-methylase UbiE
MKAERHQSGLETPSGSRTGPHEVVIGIDAVGIRMGGGARILCDLIELLPAYNPEWRWQIYVLPRSKREFDLPEDTANVRCTEVAIGDRPAGRIIWTTSLLPRALRECKANVLISLSNLPTINPPVPTIVFFHQFNMLFERSKATGSAAYRFRMLVLGQLFYAGARRSSKILAQTDVVQAALKRKFPALAPKVHIIPSGFNETMDGGVVRSEIRDKIDASRRVRILYVAHAYAHKNHVKLIEAYARVRRTRPASSLLLTIDDPSNPSATVTTDSCAAITRTILQTAREHGVEQDIIWLGSINSAEVAYAFQQAELLVFPSLVESFGLPLVEAMVYSCPIVAADRPYAHSVAEDAAVYFNPEDAEQMCSTLLSVLAAPDVMHRLRAAGAKRKDRFLYRNICPQLVKVIGECAVGRMEEDTIPQTRDKVHENSAKRRNGDIEPALGRRVITYFDGLAGRWPRKYDERGALVGRTSQFVAAIETHLNKDSKVLDFGCGTGDIAVACHKSGREVMGMDVSIQMIALARARHVGAGPMFEVLPQQTPEIPLYDASVDGIILSSVLEYLPNPLHQILEFERILNRGGFVFATVPNPAHLRRRVEEAIRRTAIRLPRIADLCKRSVFLKRQIEYLEISRGRQPISEWIQLFESRGFSLLSVSEAKAALPLVIFQKR